MDPTILPRKPFPWRRALLMLLAVLVLAVLGFFAYDWYERDAAERNLARIIEQLDRDDPGWRLEDIEAAREVIPDAQNGALVVAAAFRALSRGRAEARDGANESIWDSKPNERLSEKSLKAIAEELRLEKASLAIARRLIGFDTGRYPNVEHKSDPLVRPLPHVEWISDVISLLQADALESAEQEDIPRALRACRTLVKVGWTLGDDFCVGSLLTRFRTGSKACGLAERILAQGTPAEEDLLALQQLLETEDSWNGLPLAARGERALFHKFYQQLETGAVNLDELRKEPRFANLPLPSSASIREEHVQLLHLTALQVEAAKQPILLRKAVQAKATHECSSLPPGTWLRVIDPDLSKLEAADRRYHARLRSCAAMVAAERFRIRHSRWPLTIEELNEFSAESSLIDPCDGRLLRLRRELDGLVIYSVGDNGIDDGGTEESLGLLRLDVGFRLWDLTQRRQPPKPKESDEEPGRLIPGLPR